jgi:hypothetical protein
MKEFIYQIKSSQFNPRYSISEQGVSTKQRQQVFLTVPASSSNLLLQLFLGLPLLRYSPAFQLKTCFSVAEEFFLDL